jgi:NodT family efflux transporter outer membrane factor (OMF) lipoprotein
MSKTCCRYTIVAALVFLAGCAVGPDFERPAAPEVAGYAPELKKGDVIAIGDKLQHLEVGQDVPGEWWVIFHNDRLDALIAEALRGNADIAAARAALRAAEENVKAQDGAFFPTVDGSVSPSRNKTATGSLSPASASGNPYYNLYTAQLSVSYSPDVFGLNRRTVESLAAQAEMQRFQLEATTLTVTSGLVAAAVQEASLRGQIAATESIIKAESETLDLLKRQSSLGQIPEANVVTQQAALAQAQATLPPLKKQLAQQRDLVAALTGHYPSDATNDAFELDNLYLPIDLPVTLPSKLVEQRPDIRAAEASLHSASALIGVAIANRLPNLTLTAVDGSAATKVGNLLTPGNGFWSIAANITQPLFDGFALLHKQRAAEAAYDQAAQQYRSTVVNAFQNVADALRALQADAEAVEANLVAERAAAESLAIARKQIELGDVSYLFLLTAQQTYQQAVIARIQAQGNRFADTAALYQALGGGWWNRKDVPQAAGNQDRRDGGERSDASSGGTGIASSLRSSR